MKIFFCIWAMIALSISLSAQLRQDYNSPRSGDIIIKQQVEFKEPGSAEKNQIWDFSKLKTINDWYSVAYTHPPIEGDSLCYVGTRQYMKKNVSENEFVVGTEHNTMYYYQIKDGNLLVLGHENPTTVLTYDLPMYQGIFPFDYGDQLTREYESSGKYSGRIEFESKGNINIVADAYGSMILPDGDTIKHVLRTKALQTIYGNDSVPNTKFETCKWYSKGYRYPIFETIKMLNPQDTDNTNQFATAFFYSPQEHYYLYSDEKNMAILDSLWDASINKEVKELRTATNPEAGKSAFSYFPNPIKSDLTVEYVLESDSPVVISIYNMEGKLIKAYSKNNVSKGSHQEPLDCSFLQKGTYILRFETKTKTLNEKIIKL